MLLSGCAATQLKYSTGRQASTLTDMQFRQVLDNLAAFVDNPGTMPYFAVIGQGTVQVNDTGSIQDTLSWAHHTFPMSMFNIGPFSRAVSEQWTIGPVTDPDKLKKIRCLFQMAAGREFPDCYDCQTQLSDVGQDDRCQLAPCWYQVGQKWSIPKHANYVGRHGTTCVWVTPDGVDSLTRLTLAILDVATAAGPGGTTPAAMAPFPAAPAGTATKPRLNFYYPLPNLMFTPSHR